MVLSMCTFDCSIVPIEVTNQVLRWREPRRVWGPGFADGPVILVSLGTSGSHGSARSLGHSARPRALRTPSGNTTVLVLSASWRAAEGPPEPRISAGFWSILSQVFEPPIPASRGRTVTSTASCVKVVVKERRANGARAIVEPLENFMSDSTFLE